MSNNKRIVSYICLAFVTLLAWSICLTNAQKNQLLEEVVELRYEAALLNVEHIKQLEKGEAESKNKMVQNILAWEQLSKQKIENTALHKSAVGETIQVYGDLAMLFPIEKIQGQMLYEGDQEGALISEGLAYSLWGNTNVVGKNLTLEAKDYIVRGVLEEESNCIIIQADMKDQDTQFSALRVQLVDGGNVEEDMTTLKFKYNLPEGVLNNLSLTSIFLSGLALLPGYLLGIYGLVRFYKFIYNTHRYWVSAIFLSLIGIGLTWVTVDMMQLSMRIPDYMIPNKWSDFEFWSKLLENAMQNRQAIQALPSLLADQWYGETQVMLAGSFGITCIGIIALIKNIKVDGGKTLFLGILMAAVLSFIAAMIVYKVEGQVVLIKAFWGILPMYLLITFIISKWRQLLELDEV